MKFKSLALVLSLASSPFIIAQDYLYRTPLDGVKASSGTNQPAEPATPEIGDIYEGGYYAGAVGWADEEVIVGKIATSNMSWYSANSYCDNLTESGYDDWILPDGLYIPNSLRSINEFVPNYDNINFWSSDVSSSKEAWIRRVSSNDSVSAFTHSKGVNYSVFCIRLI